MRCFQVLKITPTKDKRQIKQAYAKLSKQYHPEEFPEEFKQLQQAFKEAMAYACEKQIDQQSSFVAKPNEIIVDISSNSTKSHPLDLDDGSLNHQEDKNDATNLILDDYEGNVETSVNSTKETNYDQNEYLIHKLTKQLENGITLDELDSFFQDFNDQDQAFKDTVEFLLIEHQKEYSLEILKYLQRIADKYKFKQLNKKLKPKLKNKALLTPKSIIYFVVLMISIVGSNIMRMNENDSENKKITQPTQIDLSDVQKKTEDMLISTNEIAYQANQQYLNGVVVKYENSQYQIVDSNQNQLVNQPIQYVGYTFSNMLILKIDDLSYLYDTSTMQLKPQAYQEINQLIVNDDMNNRKLLTTIDKVNWQICSLDGRVEISLAPETVIPSTPSKATIENGNVILS